MEDLDRLHKEIVAKIKEYEDLAKNEEDSKLRYIVQQRLRIYRATNRITQDQLAKRLGVNRIQIIRWEQGFFKPQKWVIDLLQEHKILDMKE